MRDRVVELTRVPAGELRAHPGNWRRHPEPQRAALRGLLDEIGFAGAVLARRAEDGGLDVIDGHLRQEEADPGERLPVLVLDVTAEEADKLLASLDPIGEMAARDESALRDLLGRVESEDEGLRDLLAALAAERVAEPPEEFPRVDSDLHTDYRCPSCGHEWSGSPK